MRARRWASAAALAGLVLSGCSPSATDEPSSAPSGASGTRTDTPQAVDATITKLLVVVVENHSLDEMRSSMPYTYGLAEQYGYATRFQALVHPSLPNYLAIAGGDMFGVTDDGPPSDHPVEGESVFGQALALHKTATLYADGMPANCSVEDGGDRYAVKHNPWAYFTDERASCQEHDVPLDAFAADVASGDLPNAGMLIPNLCHDAHDSDCDLGDADDWLEEYVGQVLAGPDYASGHLAVVVTADEDDGSQDNTVLTTVFHPSQRGNVVTSPLSSYSLTRLYDQVLGAPLLRNAASAPDMAEAFGLEVTGTPPR